MISIAGGERWRTVCWRAKGKCRKGTEGWRRERKELVRKELAGIESCAYAKICVERIGIAGIARTGAYRIGKDGSV